MTGNRKTSDPEQELADRIGEFYYDPYGYVMFNFPWGEKGTVLENKTGPREWQKDFLIEWGRQIVDRDFDGVNPVMPIEIDVASGHGIGKSACSAWIIKFVHDTRPNSKGCVTANTSDQLKTKTWAELGKWHKLSLTYHWSEYFASRGNMALVNPRYPETWRVDALTCREENSESFAGLHADGSTPFYLFDEASAVPDKIWEVSDGGLTDGEPMRFAFGNPTRNTGRFSEYFGNGKLKNKTVTRQIDSRTVEGVNKKYLDGLIEDFGIDSDYCRVRVLGRFPVAGDIQFIESDRIFKAQKNKPEVDLYTPIIVGVDVARFGNNKSVIRARHGRDARSYPVKRFEKNTTVRLHSEVIKYCEELEQRGFVIGAVCVDGGGVGGGVVDSLKEFSRYKIVEVVNNADPDDPKKYYDTRTECYARLREWLPGGAIPSTDDQLESELVSIEYGFGKKGQSTVIKLAPKDNENSPDDADALAITFAVKLQTLDRLPLANNQSGDTLSDEDADIFASLY